MTKALSIAELAAMAAQTEDQTVETVTTFDNEPPEAGVTVGRFIEYVELGKHPQNAYQGKAKGPADKVRLTFELLHPKKNIKEYEHEGEQRVRGEHVTITIAKKLSDKAKFRKLFNTMTYGRDSIKHMAQMLGEAFIINIYHNKVEATADKKAATYVNLDKDGVYGISAPFVTDPLEGTKTPVPVREPIRPLRLFLFDNPTKETWDSLFIEGTREVKKDGGATEQVSKNWLQETIQSALNYNGSALQALLGGVADLPVNEELAASEDEPEEEGSVEEAIELPTDPDDAPFDGGTKVAPKADPVQKVVAKAAAKAAAKPAEKAKPVAATKTAAPAGGAQDALAALGLS